MNKLFALTVLILSLCSCTHASNPDVDEITSDEWKLMDSYASDTAVFNKERNEFSDKYVARAKNDLTQGNFFEAIQIAFSLQRVGSFKEARAIAQACSTGIETKLSSIDASTDPRIVREWKRAEGYAKILSDKGH